jgi:His/Glu/Gln/Arg/opine family amino acid ABC transporter permease subunit
MTLRIGLSCAAMSLVFGTVFGLGRLSPRHWLSVPCAAAIELFRAIPLILLLYFSLIGLPTFGWSLPPFWVLSIPIMLHAGSVFAEIVQAGVNSLDRGQFDADFVQAYALTAAIYIVITFGLSRIAELLDRPPRVRRRSRAADPAPATLRPPSGPFCERRQLRQPHPARPGRREGAGAPPRRRAGFGAAAAEPQDPAGNLLRHDDGQHVTAGQIASLVDGAKDAVAFSPSRVFLHDTNGVPVLTDLAALRLPRGGPVAARRPDRPRRPRRPHRTRR